MLSSTTTNAFVSARAADRYFSDANRNTGTILGSPGTDLIWGGGKLADAWPAHPDDAQYETVQTSNVEALLIGGELDFTTPPQAATRELLPHLPNGHEVVLPQLGHSTSFWTEQPEASTQLIDTFLDSGRVDDSGYEPMSVDFTPQVTHPALAKGFAGAMIGLSLLTLLSLLGMARRVHKRGGFGRNTSLVLRSVYPVILGLGGWFTGALVVLSMPGVPVDDDLVAALSVGLPVGLGGLPRLGESRLVGQDQDHRACGSGWRRPRRRLARLSRNRRADRSDQHDCGGDYRGQPALLALDMASAPQPRGRVVENNRSAGQIALQAQEDLS
jgi:hypothetical protein